VQAVDDPVLPASRREGTQKRCSKLLNQPVWVRPQRSVNARGGNDPPLTRLRRPTGHSPQKMCAVVMAFYRPNSARRFTATDFPCRVIVNRSCVRSMPSITSESRLRASANGSIVIPSILHIHHAIGTLSRVHGSSSPPALGNRTHVMLESSQRWAARAGAIGENRPYDHPIANDFNDERSRRDRQLGFLRRPREAGRG